MPGLYSRISPAISMMNLCRDRRASATTFTAEINTPNAAAATPIAILMPANAFPTIPIAPSTALPAESSALFMPCPRMDLTAPAPDDPPPLAAPPADDPPPSLMSIVILPRSCITEPPMSFRTRTGKSRFHASSQPPHQPPQSAHHYAMSAE